MVLCTRNFIALKKRSNDTLSLTRLSACLHLTWSSTEPGIFGAVGFCDSNHCALVPNKTPCTVKQLFSHQKLIGLRLRPCVHAPAAMCKKKRGTTKREVRTTKREVKLKFGQIKIRDDQWRSYIFRTTNREHFWGITGRDDQERRWGSKGRPIHFWTTRREGGGRKDDYYYTNL